MKKLIDNQTIAFDVHKAGDRQAVDLSGLHMHKRMNGRKFRGVNVIVPLDEKQELVFRPANTKESVRTHIVNEITRELNRDLTKRRKLVETVTSQIERYSDAMPLEDQLIAIRRGAERIADFFSKNSSIKEEMKQLIEQQLEMIITRHKKDGVGFFYVKQDFKRKRIKVGDDLEEINKNNEKRDIV